MAVAAPVIVAEMDDWLALGGRNSGIVGNEEHRSGFHRAASEVPPEDYSRRRDPNGAHGPYVSWDYACAGDFWHGDDPRLLAYHRRLLARLEAGDPRLSMVCEFIGQPDAAGPVIYWSRWGGRSTYRGAGHGLWSHISWYRSRANERAYLWRDEDMPLTDEDLPYIRAGVHSTQIGRSGVTFGQALDGLRHLPGTVAALQEQVTALAARPPVTIDYDQLADAIVRRAIGGQ